MRSIKACILIGERGEYHLNGIPHRVHWIRNRRTIQLKWLPAIIRSNICDGNTGITPRPAQYKVVEADFDDVPTGDRDIPDTSAVLREAVGKIGT